MATYFEREFKRKDKEGNVTSTYTKWCGEDKINGTLKTVYGKTKKECVSKIKDLLVEDGTQGFILDKTSITLEQWVYKHLFTNMITRISSTTFEVYMTIYDNHISGTKFGKLRLQDIKPMDITAYFNGKLDNSQAWNNKIKFLLNGSFKSAKSNKLIRSNPLDDFELPRSHKEVKTIKVFTVDEQKLYVKSLTTSTIDTLLLVALYSGLRMGELIALKWDNYTGKSFEVKESIKYTKVYKQDGSHTTTNLTKKPKTINSIRDVPLPKMLIKILCGMDKSTRYIFTSSAGTCLNINNIRRRHLSICSKASLPNIGLHALRHSYATRLLELEESPKVIQTLLGHADIKTTLNVYGHILKNTKMNAVSKLDSL